VTHRSIKVKLHGWFPYLYVKAPEGWIDSSAHHDCIRLAMREGLALELEENKPLQKLLFKERFQEPIISMELVVGTDIMGFHPSNEGQLFLKQSIVSPLFITPLRNCWEGGHHIRVGERGIPEVRPGSTPTFNSNLDPVLQFMVDKGVSGCQWCRVCLDEEGCAQDSHCDYEIQCEVSKLQVLSLEERSDLGPLRILSFDLEAAGRRGVFPDPMVDPVIQISIHFEPKRDPILLSFKECSPIEGAHVFCFEKEDELLLAFRDIVVHFDADILTGYNICNFDMEYLQKRAVALEIGTEFALMTRMRKVKMTVQELFFQSAQVLLHFPPRLFFSRYSYDAAGGQTEEQPRLCARKGCFGRISLDVEQLQAGRVQAGCRLQDLSRGSHDEGGSPFHGDYPKVAERYVLFSLPSTVALSFGRQARRVGRNWESIASRTPSCPSP